MCLYTTCRLLQWICTRKVTKPITINPWSIVLYKDAGMNVWKEQTMSVGRSRLRNLIGMGILCTRMCVCVCDFGCILDIHSEQLTVLLNTRKTLYCQHAVEIMSLNNLRNTYLEPKVLNFNTAYSKLICSNTTDRTDGRNEEWVWYLRSLASLTHCCVWTSLEHWYSYMLMVLCLLAMGVQKWDRGCIQKWYRLVLASGYRTRTLSDSN